MLCRGRTHTGTCAIAVAGLVCGLWAASLPLAAQILPTWPDQPRPDDGAGFEERFSPGRMQPLFTHPDIQALIASLPPSANPEEALAAAPEAEPQPAESTASVEGSQPGPEATASVPGPQAEPNLPPPVYPPDVSVAPERPPVEAAEARAHQPQAHVLRNPAAKPGARRGKEKPKVARGSAAVTSSTRGASGESGPTPHMPPAASACPPGTPCLSQPQTFGAFFGFVVGGLLGGPVGALAGGALGAAMTAGAPPDKGAGPPTKP